MCVCVSQSQHSFQCCNTHATQNARFTYNCNDSSRLFFSVDAKTEIPKSLQPRSLFVILLLPHVCRYDIFWEWKFVDYLADYLFIPARWKVTSVEAHLHEPSSPPPFCLRNIFLRRAYAHTCNQTVRENGFECPTSSRVSLSFDETLLRSRLARRYFWSLSLAITDQIGRSREPTFAKITGCKNARETLDCLCWWSLLETRPMWDTRIWVWTRVLFISVAMYTWNCICN